MKTSSKPSAAHCASPRVCATRRATPAVHLRPRGAAMVEAAVVLPVLVCFLGLGAMMHKAYETKLEQNQTIRNAALSLAAHDCDRSRADRASADLATTPSPLRPPPRAANGDTERLQNVAERNMPILRGEAGQADATYADRVIANPLPNKATKGFGLELRLRGARSSTLCNEEPKGDSLGDMAETMIDEISKAVGPRDEHETSDSDEYKKD